MKPKPRRPKTSKAPQASRAAKAASPVQGVSPPKNQLVTLYLSQTSLQILCDALDSYAYTEVAEPHERNNGFVYFPASDSAEFAAGDKEEKERWTLLEEIESLEDVLHDLSKEFPS